MLSFFLCCLPQGSTVNMNTNNIIYSGLSGISPNYVRLGTVLMFGK